MSIKNIVQTGFLASTLFLAACGGGGGEAPSQPKVYDYERADSLDKEYLRGLATIRVNIEETAKLNEAFRDAGVSFNSSGMHSSSRASSYSNSKSQALNLGVYAADLNYAVCYQSESEMGKALDATLTLADKLGVRAAFNEDMLNKLMEADTNTNRSVVLTNAYMAAEDQLYSEDRMALATYMIAGGWIEGMYLAAESMKDKAGNREIWEGLFNHAYNYRNVVDMVTYVAEKQGDAEFKALLEELKKVNKAVKKIENAKRERPSPVVIEELRTAITELRNSITS